MRTFKTVDCVIQIALIVAGVFLGLASWSQFGDMFFFGYFTVGAWQILSICVHLVDRSYSTSRLRKIYYALLGITILIGIVMSTAGNYIMVLLGLLFWSPVLALIYLAACIEETWKTPDAAVIKE